MVSREIISLISIACVLAVLVCIVYPWRRGKDMPMQGIDSSAMSLSDWAIVALFAFAYGWGALEAAWSKPEVKTSIPSVSLVMFGLLPVLVITAPVAFRLMLNPLRQMAAWSNWHWKSLLLPIVLIPVVVYTVAGLQELSGLTAFFVHTCGASDTQDTVRYLENGSPALQWAMGFGAIVVAPFAEELCFRGFFYPLLKKHAGRWASLLIVSIFFAVIHQGLVQLIPLFVLSALLIWSYERSRSLWVPICTHAFFNALTVASVFF